MKILTIFLTVAIIILWAVTIKLYWKNYSEELADDPEFKMGPFDWVLAILMHIPVVGSILVIYAFSDEEDFFDDMDQHFFI